MTNPSNVDLESEETRIKTVYAQRQGASRYSWFNQGHLFHIQELERDILSALRARDLTQLQDKKILEIGCGQGLWIREFIQWGAQPENMTGIDVIPERVSQGKRLCPQGVRISCGNAAKLSFDSASFDLILQFTVFSSILDMSVKERIAGEMLRVLKDGGVILWYDLCVNNPQNPNVKGLRKPEIVHLFPGCRVDFRRVSLAPPLARFLAPYSWLACHALAQVRVFNTHYLAVLSKNSLLMSLGE